jgi:MFS family permease
MSAPTYDYRGGQEFNEKTSDSSEKASVAPEYDPKFEQRTMRYVDWRLIPILAMVYSFALIDRINLGAAYTAGMGADLKLAVGARYNLIILLFFIPYTIFQLPGNIVLRQLGVRRWLTFIVFAWGLVQFGMTFVRSWGWMIICRILMGIFEASFFPALLFIMSTWYKRHEVQKRLAAFFLLSVTTGGLSPILAWAFSLLNGKANLAGWRWIFLIEGIITILLGFVTWFFIPDFPDQNRFLTPEQTALVLKRIDEDRGDALPDPVTYEKVKKHLLDWTIWAHGIIFLCNSMPSYSQSYFLPIILKDMGWTKTQALLLSAPPYGPPIVTTLLVAYLADKYKHRGGFLLAGVLTCIVGICLLAFAEGNGARYFGAFLVAAGNSGCTPTIWAYASNNVTSHSKRSIQTAVQISLGGIGGVLATVVYRSKDAPRYVPGLAVTLGAEVVLLTLLGITTFHYNRLNRLVRSGKRKEPLEGQPGFYYTL